MAEDLLIGFKFYDREDNKDADEAVWAKSNFLFNEAAVDHLGARAEIGNDDSSMTGVGETDRVDVIDSFEFTEGFDHIM